MAIRPLTKRNGSWGRILLFAAVVLVLAATISEGYRYAALNGWLGDFERQRYLVQSQSKVGILGGRSEFAAALFAIADSPFIGHGSWAKDEKGYRDMGAAALGMDASGVDSVSPLLIPGHSHLWGPWISHGILGFVAWFYMLIFIGRFLVNYLSYVPGYLPFLLLFGLGSLWHIIFSPVGFRPLAAAGYALLFILAEMIERYGVTRVSSNRAFIPSGRNARLPMNGIERVKGKATSSRFT